MTHTFIFETKAGYVEAWLHMVTTNTEFEYDPCTNLIKLDTGQDKSQDTVSTLVNIFNNEELQ